MNVQTGHVGTTVAQPGESPARPRHITLRDTLSHSLGVWLTAQERVRVLSREGLDVRLMVKGMGAAFGATLSMLDFASSESFICSRGA